MAGRHQPQPLRFLLIRAVRYLNEMSHHAFDQGDERCGRRLLAEQMCKIRIGLTLFREDLGIECSLGGEVLEQQAFRNGRSGRHALGRGAGKAVTGKASLRGAQDQLPPQITGHAQGRHERVSNHSPWRSQGYIAAHQANFGAVRFQNHTPIALFARLFPGNPVLTLPAHPDQLATPTRRRWIPAGPSWWYRPA